MRYTNYNRISDIIANKNNGFIHIKAILKMVENYELMFGCSNLSKQLFKKFDVLNLKFVGYEL